MRFKIEPSAAQPGWWVLADTDNLIVCKFEHGKFNETQKVTEITDENINPVKVATIMREMGEWVVRYHSSKAFSRPFVWEYDNDEQLYLAGTRKPVWRLAIEKGCSLDDLAKSLEKASEFIRKRSE